MRPPRANLYRDAWAGELDAARVDEHVRVAGWVNRRRDHGGVIFIDLRDRSGIVQLTFHPESPSFALAEKLRPEHVLSAAGTVVKRDERNVNPNLKTGEIELDVKEAEHLAEALTPPFAIDEDGQVDEMIRLRHRMLDLRRQNMQEAIILRHTVNRSIRDFLNANDFLEIETPILTRSTPEGARDFLVPARLNPGAFYALPQSPQLFKQLLMMSGYERYYQIARCFRDEDLRADRQPEFTQLDLEMGFVEEEDVLGVIEGLLHRVFEDAGFPAPPPPWRRMPYDEAMLKYGSDKPDLRFAMEIQDLAPAVANTEFRVFKGVLEGGGVVRGFNAGPREATRKIADELTEVVKRYGAGGLVWAVVEEGGTWRSPVAKALSDEDRAAIEQALEAKPGDLLLIVADARRTSPPRRWASCGWRSRAATTSSPRAATSCCGSWTSRCSSGTRARSAGTRSITRSRRRPAPSTIRARCSRARTTSCSTARRSAAGRSVSTAPRSSSRCSPRSASPRRRRSRASASCWTRSSTARRRTVASRSASTGSWPSWPTGTRSAT